MKILVVNAGSSSLKYQLLNVERNEVIVRGHCERIGQKDAYHVYGENGEIREQKPMATADDAVKVVLEALLDGPEACISDTSEISAIGHRVVSGGDYFSESVFIDEDVIAKIEECSELAPLHNPGALKGIYACRHIMPEVPQVAVFDTAFYQTLAPSSYIYPLPYRYYEDYHIKRYGAHGTSHRYVARRAAALMGRDVMDLKMITCHLGSGASITAIDHAHAVDTSMGFTPLEGLMMGTRCGSIDPAVVTYIMKKENLTPEQMENIMNRESGLIGISGVSDDLREVRDAAFEGNRRAILAYEMYAHSVKKYIGQYLALMGGVDVIALTAGVGENSTQMRRLIFSGLETLGIILDQEKNRLHGFERIISDDRSRVTICVIPTNEEYMIARDCYKLITGEHLPFAKYREEEMYASEPDQFEHRGDTVAGSVESGPLISEYHY